MNTQLFNASDIINKYQRLKKFHLEAIWSDGYLKDSVYTVLRFGRFTINLKTGTQILTTFLWLLESYGAKGNKHTRRYVYIST